MSVEDVLAWLEESGTEKARQDMLRYGIPNDNAFGVSIGTLKAKAKAIGKDPALARDLWASGSYEARTLAAFLHDPQEMARSEATAWVRDFDNWAICDTCCFHLIDRTPFAWDVIEPWAQSEQEFVSRAAFATIWGLSVHDKSASDDKFHYALSMISKAPSDDRPLVKKAVNMALRAIGKRNARLNAAAIETATTLSEEHWKDRQWIGRHALKELQSEKIQAKFER